MFLHIEYVLRPPSLEEYRSLCTAVGWDEAINFAAAPLSLMRSLFAVTVLDKGEAVGMGRVVGDGALYFYIQDIAVRPDHQGLGIGRAIMDRIMEWLNERAPDHAFIGLFAADGRDSFYAHYGFLRHPALTGMFYVMPARREIAEVV